MTEWILLLIAITNLITALINLAVLIAKETKEKDTDD